MPEATPEQSLPSAVQAPIPEELGRVHADLVEHLLRPGTLEGVEPEDQGALVVDRFIGQLARTNGAVGSNGIRLNAADVVFRIDRVANLTTQTKGLPFEKAVLQITKTDGLRKAVYDLAGDERTGQYFGKMFRRIGVTEEGQPTLRTIGQLEGYLYADVDSPKGASTTANWQDTMMARIAEYVNGNTDEPAWESDKVTISGLENVRARQLAWNGAVSSARAVGIDMELIKRSAQEARRLHEQQGDIGSTALQGALFNFNKMFE